MAESDPVIALGGIMDYHWFPGHMAKALRKMKEDLKLIDLVIELVDARIPRSGSNPVLDDIAGKKPRLVILNKSDLAEEAWNQRWKQYFESKGAFCVACDSKNKRGIRSVTSAALSACKEIVERNRKRGLQNRPIRAMVVGIPNVGKSTFINALAGKNVTKTGNKPGVTKGVQWIRLNKDLELLDTPGVLWPKFEDEEIGKRIAFIGSMNADILAPEELVFDLMKWIAANQPDLLEKRYGITVEDPLQAMETVAEKRGCLQKGGRFDFTRASNLFLDDFRSGKLGPITLDREVSR